MSVHVRIPVKLRVDVRAARSGQSQICAALGRALDRALENMVTEFSDRGSDLSYDVLMPAVKWSGAALQQLDPDDLRACDRMLADLVAERSHAALQEQGDVPAVPEVLPANARSPFVEDQVLAASYVLDSYETGGAEGTRDAPPRRATVAFLGTPQHVRETYDRAVWEGHYYTFTGRADLMRAVRMVILSAIEQGHQVPNQRVGFIFVGPGNAVGMTRRVIVIDYAGDAENLRSVGIFTLGGTETYSIDPEAGLAPSDSGAGPSSLIGIQNLCKNSNSGNLEADFTDLVMNRDRAILDIAIDQRMGTDVTPQERANVHSRYRESLAENVSRLLADAQTEAAGQPLAVATLRTTTGESFPGFFVDMFGEQTSLPLYSIAYLTPTAELETGEASGGAVAGGEVARVGGEGARVGGEGGTSDAGTDDDGAGVSGGDDPNATGTSTGTFPFPAPTLRSPGDSLVCEPLNEEPTLDTLGDAAGGIASLMRRIAWRLSMPECKYPGQFLVNAAKVWGGRAAAASGFAGERAAVMRLLEGQEGALGDLDFEPAPSPVIDSIRHLAGTVPLMNALLDALYDLYRDPAQEAKLGGYFQGEGILWNLRLREAFVPEIKQSIGFGFKVACQSCLLQSCLSSRQQILERMNNFDNYWPIFDSLLRSFLAPQARLELLRERLNAHYARHAPDMESTVNVVATNWRDAREALMASLEASQTSEIIAQSEETIGTATTPATIMSLESGGYGVRDEDGKIWTRDELNQAVALRSGVAQAIDPLVGKIKDLPQAVIIVQNEPATSREYIRALLTEMLDSNTEVMRDAEDSANFAFRASKINESIERATIPGTSVQLGGIHMIAHQAIGDAFMGDPFYGLAIDQIFGIELGTQSLLQFFEITGTVLLSIACPPAGIALGIGVASVHLYFAYEQMEIVEGLFDNDQIVSNSTAELDLFMAELEAVFNVIPLAGKALKLGGRGVIGVARSGARNAGRRALRGITRDIAEEIASNLKRGLPFAFMTELAQDQIMGQVAQQAMTPVIMQLQRELSLTDTALPIPDAAAEDPAIGSEAEQARDAHRIEQRLREGDDERARRSEGSEAARRGDP